MQRNSIRKFSSMTAAATLAAMSGLPGLVSNMIGNAFAAQAQPFRPGRHALGVAKRHAVQGVLGNKLAKKAAKGTIGLPHGRNMLQR
jgi:hypothetical protein